MDTERDSQIITQKVSDMKDYIEELEDELERVKAQRDKAVENLERFCGQDVLTISDLNNNDK